MRFNTIWANKYRPSLDEIVGQDEIVGEMKNIVNLGGHPSYIDNFQHYLFYSREAGTGKTSMAYAIAKELDWPIHIFNASSKATRGIDFIQNELIPLTSIGTTKQIILLDEADQLTPDAQGALKGVIENSQGYFILTCNDLSKVSDYLQSRCSTRFFRPVDAEDIKLRLTTICHKESVDINEVELNMIVNHHAYDLRNAINALQTFASFANHDDRHRFLQSFVVEEIPSVDILRIISKDKDFNSAYNLCKKINSTDLINSIFNYAIDSNAKPDSKMRVINASIISLRDIMGGIDDNIVKCNFLRLLLPNTLYPKRNPNKLEELK